MLFWVGLYHLRSLLDLLKLFDSLMSCIFPFQLKNMFKRWATNCCMDISQSCYWEPIFDSPTTTIWQQTNQGQELYFLFNFPCLTHTLLSHRFNSHKSLPWDKQSWWVNKKKNRGGGTVAKASCSKSILKTSYMVVKSIKMRACLLPIWADTLELGNLSTLTFKIACWALTGIHRWRNLAGWLLGTTHPRKKPIPLESDAARQCRSAAVRSDLREGLGYPGCCLRATSAEQSDLNKPWFRYQVLSS